MEPPTVVIDNGTGYTKMGYAGNMDPNYIIPSTIATSLSKVSILSTFNINYQKNTKFECSELDYYIGDEAMNH